MLSLSILALAAAAPSSDLQGPAFRSHTVRSLNAFGECFRRAQEADSKPWAFIPNGNGGVFTDAGAEGVAKPYFLRVIEAKPRNEVRLFAGDDAARNSLVAVVRRCG